MSITPFAIIGAISMFNSGKALSSLAFGQLKSIREVKKTQIQNIFAEQKKGMDVLIETMAGFQQAAFAKVSSVQENKKAQLNAFLEKSNVDLKIVVKDTGVGIPKEDQKIIFEAFRQQQDHASRAFGGTGLGLSICRRLVEMMNGFIRVKSDRGKGSAFEIYLRDVEVGSCPVPSREDDTFEIENIRFNRAKILVVDDVESNRDLLRELLPRVNLDILTADNGKEAILLAREYRPDLIIMDIIMPVMNGIEATKRLKASQETEDIPVIALTASVKPEDRP